MAGNGRKNKARNQIRHAEGYNVNARWLDKQAKRRKTQAKAARKARRSQRGK